MTPAKLIMSFLILFCGCAKPIFTEPPPSTSQFGTDETLDIITWNIENFPKSNSLTVDYLSQLIIELDADIIALQEIESQLYFDELLNHLDGWEGYKANSASYDVNLAILFKSELSVLSINEIPSLNSNYLPRTPLMMEMVWGGEHVYIINNHYKCCGNGSINYDDEWDEEYRRLQGSNQIKSYVDTYLSDYNVVILGDLNDEIQEPQTSNVFWAFINDDGNYKFADTDIANGSSTNWSWPGWNSAYSASHLDHILITNELFNNHDTTFTILAENNFSGWAEYDDVISDHRPVGIRLMFGE